MNHVKIAILLLVLQKSGQSLLSVQEKEPVFPTSECIVYILNKYFKNSFQISVKYSGQQSSAMTDLLKEIDLPIVINSKEGKSSDIDNKIPDDVSIIMEELTNISRRIDESKWTQETQFIVITNQSQTPELKMTDIFQEFWAMNIVNVLLLATDNDDIHIYTFKPFNSNNCAIPKPVLLTTWASGRICPIIEIVQKEHVADLNGCTLNASVINIPPMIIFPKSENTNGSETVTGIEGSTLMEISRKLNFKWNIAEPKDKKDWGRIKPIPNGAVGEIFLKKSHFACGRLSDNPDRYKYLDMSVPISCERECITWAVPIGAKKSLPGWMSLYIKGFSNIVWYFITATFIAAVSTFRSLSKASANDRQRFRDIIKTIFYTLQSSFGESVSAPKSSALQIFFISWLWYCLIIITAYQALIGSKLTVPFKQPNINTFKDLLESDVHITAMPSIFNAFARGREEKEIKDIERQFEGISFDLKEASNFYKEAIEKLISGQKIAYLWSSTTIMHIIMQHPKAKGLVHFLKECLYEYYSIMLLQKNSPLTPKVNRIIRALFESGIICKWRRQYAYDIPQPEPEVKKLALNRMIGAFIILGAGLGIAVVAFLAECIIYWYSSHK